jgi:hypothetical protein
MTISGRGDDRRHDSPCNFDPPEATVRSIVFTHGLFRLLKSYEATNAKAYASAGSRAAGVPLFPVDAAAAQPLHVHQLLCSVKR